MAAARALAGTAFTLADLLALRHAAKRLALGGRTAPTSWRAGARASRIRGRGMTFVESRPYDSGDDARLIDWRVTARTGRPHTKVFEEEKERAVFVVAQFSPSMYFGTRSAFKHVIAAELAAVVGWAAMAGGDRIGGLLASAGGHAELRPAAGRRALMTLFNALAALAAPPAGAVAPLSETLSRAVRVARTGAVVFVAGDFYDFDDDAADHLVRLARHNDVVLCQVLDRVEIEPPPRGLYPVSDGTRFAMLPVGGADDAFARLTARLARPLEFARRHRLPHGRVVAGQPVADQFGAIL